jgi:hypothetical protein
MPNNFRPEPQDGFARDDFELHEYLEYIQDKWGSDCDDYDIEDDWEDDSDDGDGQPSEYDEWMGFDPDC